MAGMFGLPTGSGASLPPGLITNPQDAGLVPAPLAASGIVAAPPDGIVGAQPQAQAAPQPALAPQPSPSQPQPAPTPPPNPFMDAVRMAGNFVSGLAGGQSNTQPGALPLPAPTDGSGNPVQAPLYPRRGVVGDVLDNLVLGGAIQHARQTEFGQQMANYQREQMIAFANTLTVPQRAAFLADPQGFMSASEENLKPQKLAGGETDVGPGIAGVAPVRTAPLIGFDTTSGEGYSVSPQGGLTTGGAQLPGSVTASNGLLIDSRRPVPVGTYEQNVPVPREDILHKIAPTVYRGPQVPQLPNGAPAPTAAGPIVPQLGGDGAVGQAAPPSAGFSSGLGIPQIGDPPAPTAANTLPSPMAPAPASSPTASLSAIRANPAGFFGSVLGRPVTITSAQRSASRNAAVGGSPTSEHLTGSAWDMSVPGMATTEVASKLAAAGVPFDQIIDEGNHTHFGIGPKMRGQVLQADGKGGYRPLGGAAAGATTSAAPGADTEIAGHDSASGTSGPLFTIKDGADVPGGKPGERYKVNNATGEPTVVSGDGAITPATMSTRGAAFMGSEDYKDAIKTTSAINGLVGAIKSANGSNPAVSWATLDSAMRAFNPTMGVRTNTITAFMDEIGAPAELQSRVLAFQGKGFLPKAVASELLNAAYAYGESHLQVLQGRHANDVSYAKQYGMGPETLGETMPSLSPYPLTGRPDPATLVSGRAYETPKGVLRWTGSNFVAP